ncbi:MAG: hypothetical protein ACI9DJ_003168, partial [Algoriphagus sp.]
RLSRFPMNSKEIPLCCILKVRKDNILMSN